MTRLAEFLGIVTRTGGLFVWMVEFGELVEGEADLFGAGRGGDVEVEIVVWGLGFFHRWNGSTGGV